MSEILVETLVSSRTKRGMVTVMLVPETGDPTSVQLAPDQAREIGAQLIEASIVAVDDELMVEVAGPRGVALMRQLRADRDRREGGAA